MQAHWHLATALILTGTATIVSAMTGHGATEVSQLSNLATPKNIRVTRDSFASHAEPSLVVNPRKPRNLLGTAQFIASTRQTARPASFASFDGGHTWHDNGPLPLPVGYVSGDDVTATFTTAGTGFIAGEVYRNRGGSAIVVWRTLDGGRSFLSPLVVYRSPSSAVNTDHPSICAALGAKPYLFVAWSYGPKLLFSRSVDDGVNFSPARTISGPSDSHPDWAVTTTGPVGAVHIVYDEGSGAPFKVVSSSDYGMHFGVPTSPPAVVAGKEPSISVSTLLGAATAPGTGVLYVTRAEPSPTSGHLQVLVWRSADAGRTWSAPKQVTANQSDHFQPQLVVDSSGNPDVAYFTLTRGQVREFLARPTRDGHGFYHETIGSKNFDPASGISGKGGTSGKGGGAGWIGDYQGLAAGPIAVYPLWNDARSKDLEIYVAVVPTH